MIDSTPETTSSESELEDNLVPLQHSSSSQQQTGTKRAGQIPGPKAKRVKKDQQFVDDWPITRNMGQDGDGHAHFDQIWRPNITINYMGVDQNIKF